VRSRSALLGLGVGLALADSSIVTLALPQILGDLGVSITSVAWVLTHGHRREHDPQLRVGILIARVESRKKLLYGGLGKPHGHRDLFELLIKLFSRIVDPGYPRVPRESEILFQGLIRELIDVAIRAQRDCEAGRRPGNSDLCLLG
jgi:hypothetical protein